MEFLNDRYASLDVSWDLNGKIFNRIPLLKKLKWREAIGFKMLYGHLTDKNNPMKHPGDSELFLFPTRDGRPTSFVMDPKTPKRASLLASERHHHHKPLRLSGCIVGFER